MKERLEEIFLPDAASSKTEAYTAQIVKVDENSTDSKGLVVKITKTPNACFPQPEELYAASAALL